MPEIEREALKSLKEGTFWYHEREYNKAVQHLEAAAKQLRKLHLYTKAGEAYFLLGESLRIQSLAWEECARPYKSSGEAYAKVRAYQKSGESYAWAGKMFKEAATSRKESDKNVDGAGSKAGLLWQAYECFFESGMQYANARMSKLAGDNYGSAGIIYKEMGETGAFKSWQWRDMAHCCYLSAEYRFEANKYGLAAEYYEEAGKLYQKEEEIDKGSDSFQTAHSVWNGKKARKGERSAESFALSADNYSRDDRCDKAARNYELSAANYEALTQWPEAWVNYKRAIIFAAKSGRRCDEELLSRMQGVVEKGASKDKEKQSLLRDIYLELRNVYSRVGMYDEAGRFFYKEKVCERKLSSSLVKRAFSHSFDRICGYGERPLRAVGFSLVLILIFTLIFLLTGIENTNDESIVMALRTKQYDVIPSYIGHSLYFSCITFTTLGYGDFRPAEGLSQFFAALEAFCGVFMIAIFIFTFGRKMMR